MFTRYRNRIVVLFSNLIGVFLYGQSTPDWQVEYADSSGVRDEFVQVECINDEAFVAALSLDTSCLDWNYSLFHYSAAGNHLNHFRFVDSGCARVDLRHLNYFDNKLYIAADDSVQMVAQTGMISVYDPSFNHLHTSRTAQTSQNLNISGSNPLMYVFSADGGTSLNCFDTLGNLRWSFQESLLYGLPTGYHTIAVRNDTVFAMASGYTSLAQSNTTIVVTILDTLGNFLDTLSIAPFGNSTNHVVCDMKLTNHGFVYSTYAGFTSGPSRTGLMDRLGNTLWEVSLPNVTKFLAVDSTSNQVYAFTTGSVSSAAWQCFRIDLISGNMLDTIQIDSAYSGSDWICFLHEEGVGVYMAYRNQQSIGSYVIERYNIYGLVDWVGAFSTTGPQLHRLKEMEISDVGSLYIVGWAIGDSSIICKFSPTPLGTTEVTHLPVINVYPNPASSSFIVQTGDISEMKTLTLYSCTGETIISSTFGGSSFEIPTTIYPSGFYLIELISESGQRTTQKLIIQH